MKQKKCDGCGKVIGSDEPQAAFWSRVRLRNRRSMDSRFDYCPDCVPGLKVMLAGYGPDSEMVRNIARRYEMLSNAINEWVASAGGPEYRDRVLLDRIDRIMETSEEGEE